MPEHGMGKEITTELIMGMIRDRGPTSLYGIGDLLIDGLLLVRALRYLWYFEQNGSRL